MLLAQALSQVVRLAPVAEAFSFCNPQLQPRRQEVQQESESDYVDPMDFSFDVSILERAVERQVFLLGQGQSLPPNCRDSRRSGSL